jgi:opacity protein-like surface antigen
MKKLMLLSAVCLTTVVTPALADDHYNYGGGQGSHTGSGWAYNTDIARDGSFNGPYFGGTVDYNWTDGDASRTGFGTSSDVSVNGFQGGVLAGYGMQFDPGFLNSIWSGYTAIELGYEWNGSNNDSELGTFFNKDDSWSVTVRPGFTWGNKALGYGIAGYSRGKFNVGADDKWLDGYSLGLGTELATFGPLKTRLEYVYTNYSSDNFNTGAGTTANFNPHDNALKLGAVFHF